MRQTEALKEEEKKEAPMKGVRSEVWHVKPRADDGQRSESSATPVNITSMLLPIQAVGSPDRS